MPESNEQQAFFIDDELIERLMRGDAAPDKAADKVKQRPADVTQVGSRGAAPVGSLSPAADGGGSCSVWLRAGRLAPAPPRTWLAGPVVPVAPQPS